VAKVILPESLTRLFPGAQRQMQVEGSDVLRIVDGLNSRFPGMRDRLLDSRPSIRRHIVIFVNGERAGLETPTLETDELQVIPAMSGG
jgi:molybdopterin converting factor small subunit